MKKYRLFLVLTIIIFLGSLFFPLASLAGKYKTAAGKNVCYEGLVPCGKEVWVGGVWQGGKCVGGTLTKVDCQFCHFFVMLDGIIDFVLFTLVPPIAVLMLVISGVMFFFVAGKPESANKAKGILTSVVLGLVIIYGAWLIINTFFTFIGLADTDLGRGIKNWFIIFPCP